MIVKLCKKDGDNIKSDFSEIYAELESILKDSAEVETIYNRYKGLTVNFPKKLYNQDYVTDYIYNNYQKKSVSDIARHVNLSERRVRQIYKETREKRG